MSDWPINAIRVWSGRLRGRGAGCAFTVALRRRSPIAVAGFFIWRVRDPQQPGATIEVRENLRGAMDPSQTLVRLRGVQSSDPLRMPVGSYALHLRRDGVLTGSTITSGTRLEGSYDPAAAARVSAHLIPEARAVRPATTGSRPLPRR